MTALTSTEAAVAPPEITAAPDDPSVPPHESSAPRPWLRRPVTAIVVLLVLLAAVVAAFEVGVTGIWYHARQRQLATDFAVGRSHLSTGDAAAVLQIPRLGVNVYVVEGDAVSQLRSGPGHRPGSPLPGKLGNSVIVGHRKGWGHPFRDLDRLKVGKDHIVVRTRGAEPTVFVVKAKRHVSGDDASLLRPSTDHRLTLVTGDGGLLSGDRLVVTAISGPAGKLRTGKAAPDDPSEPSVVFNPVLALAVLAFALAWAALTYLRRRYAAAATAVVVGPLAVAGLVCVLLDADLVLAPLR